MRLRQLFNEKSVVISLFIEITTDFLKCYPGKQNLQRASITPFPFPRSTIISFCILIVYCVAKIQINNLLIVEMCEKTIDFHD